MNTMTSFEFLKVFLFVKIKTPNWQYGKVKERAQSASHRLLLPVIKPIRSGMIIVKCNIQFKGQVPEEKRPNHKVIAYKTPANKNVNDMLFLLKYFTYFQGFRHNVLYMCKSEGNSGICISPFTVWVGSNSSHQI